MRVHELAKKLGIESKAALAALNDLGLEIKSIHSSVSDEDAERVTANVGGGAATKKTASSKATAKPKSS